MQTRQTALDRADLETLDGAFPPGVVAAGERYSAGGMRRVGL